MFKGEHSEQATMFYTETLCARADDVLRLAYFLSLNSAWAHSCVGEVFERAIDAVPVLIAQPETVPLTLGQLCWRVFAGGGPAQEDRTTNDFNEIFAKLKKDERGALILVDILELEPSVAAQIMDTDVGTLRQSLGRSRRILMGESAQGGNDSEFFFQYVSDYLNDTLGGSDRDRFRSIVQDAPFKEVLKKFRVERGHLQNSAHRLTLTEDQVLQLYSKVTPRDVEEAEEVTKINQVAHQERSGLLLRWIAFVSVIVLVGWGVFSTFKPPQKPAFQPLQSLEHEALAMENDTARLAFTSENPEEVLHYFNSYATMGFQLPQFRPLGENWLVDGAAILDYETAKIAVVQFHNANQKIFYFALNANLSALPSAEIGKVGNFEFRTFASDRLNMVVWQHSDTLLGVLAGRLSAQDLAQIAEKALR